MAALSIPLHAKEFNFLSSSFSTDNYRSFMLCFVSPLFKPC